MLVNQILKCNNTTIEILMQVTITESSELPAFKKLVSPLVYNSMGISSMCAINGFAKSLTNYEDNLPM